MANQNNVSLFSFKSSLGPLETKVMDVIWIKRICSVRDVLSSLPRERSFAYTTIMTVMDHLYQKGLVTREKVKKTYVYSSFAKEQSLTMLSLRRILADLSIQYGKGVMLMTALSISIPKFPLLPAPIWYGMGLTITAVLLGLSAVDLLRNLHVLGTFEYMTLLVSDPALMKAHIFLSLPAIIESIPIINAVTTTFSFVSAVILVRKLLRSFDQDQVSLRIGGSAV